MRVELVGLVGREGKDDFFWNCTPDLLDENLHFVEVILVGQC